MYNVLKELTEKRCSGRQPAFVLQDKRADKEPVTPDHRGLGPERERERARRDKGRDGRGHGVHLSICVCLCKCVCVLSGEGVKAKKQVPIVQYGVMREVMRGWVSRAGQKVNQAAPERARGSREQRRGGGYQ